VAWGLEGVWCLVSGAVDIFGGHTTPRHLWWIFLVDTQHRDVSARPLRSFASRLHDMLAEC